MSENTRKTAIVTGASRGIGKAIALRLAKSGYNIAIVDACPLEMSKEAENEVKALGVDAKAYECNVADFDKVAEAIAIVIKEQEAGVEKARAIIKELTDKYPLPGEAEFKTEL